METPNRIEAIVVTSADEHGIDSGYLPGLENAPFSMDFVAPLANALKDFLDLPSVTSVLVVDVFPNQGVSAHTVVIEIIQNGKPRRLVCKFNMVSETNPVLVNIQLSNFLLTEATALKVAAATNTNTAPEAHLVTRTEGGRKYTFVLQSVLDGKALEFILRRNRLDIKFRGESITTLNKFISDYQEWYRQLQILNQHNVVYLDINPGNLLLAEEGVNIIDFGGVMIFDEGGQLIEQAALPESAKDFQTTDRPNLDQALLLQSDVMVEAVLHQVLGINKDVLKNVLLILRETQKELTFVPKTWENEDQKFGEYSDKIWEARIDKLSLALLGIGMKHPHQADNDLIEKANLLAEHIIGFVGVKNPTRTLNELMQEIKTFINNLQNAKTGN